MCQYKHSKRRVWTSQEEFLHLKRQRDVYRERCTQLERQLGQQANNTNHIATPASASSITATASSPTDESIGRLLLDLHGNPRYMGETSGAAFYDQLSYILHQHLPHMSFQSPMPLHTYHTEDTNPLPEDEDIDTLPPLELTRHLVSLFFLHTSDLFLCVDPSAFKEQVEQYYRSASSTAAPLDSPSADWLALLNIIMGIASQYSGRPGTEYMARTTRLLTDICEKTHPARAQTLALMALFMLSIHHREAAYNYIGLAMRISLALGHHVDLSPSEQTQRLFWSIYCIDRLISLTLGRPVQLNDSEIATPVPSSSSTRGLNAMIELCRVASHMTTELYVWKEGTHMYSISTAYTLLARLERFSVPTDLSVPRSGSLLSLLKELLIIVICRPMLLRNLASRLDESRRSGTPPPQDQASVQNMQLKAAQAAERSSSILHILSMTNQVAAWSFFDSHIAYNTGMARLLSSLLPDYKESHQAVKQDMNTVLGILDSMANSGNKSAASCAAILRAFQTVTHLCLDGKSIVSISNTSEDSEDSFQSALRILDEEAASAFPQNHFAWSGSGFNWGQLLDAELFAGADALNEPTPALSVTDSNEI